MAEKTEVKTVGDLVHAYKTAHPNGHFFDPDTLKFFGERRSDMRLLKETQTIRDICGDMHECYVLSTIQRPGPPLKPHRKYHYFDTTTLTDVCT